jgi:hypothetical protein
MCSAIVKTEVVFVIKIIVLSEFSFGNIKADALLKQPAEKCTSC